SWWLLGPLHVLVVHGDVHRVGEDAHGTGDAGRVHADLQFVEDRDPRGVGLDLGEDLAPQRHAFVMLVSAGEGVGVSGLGLDVLVAVLRPVPAAGDVGRAGEDGPVEVVGIGVVG